MSDRISNLRKNTWRSVGGQWYCNASDFHGYFDPKCPRCKKILRSKELGTIGFRINSQQDVYTHGICSAILVFQK